MSPDANRHGGVLRRLRRIFARLQRSHLVAVSSGFAIGAMLIVLQLYSRAGGDDLLSRLDYLVYDLRYELNLQPYTPGDHRIVIIDIDEASLAAEGRWPWSRVKMARMVRRLAEAGVVVIGFDIVFSEPERNVASEMLEALQRAGVRPELRSSIRSLEKGFDADSLFASVLDQTDVVMGYFLHAEQSIRVGELPPPVLALDASEAGRFAVRNTIGYTTTLPRLQRGAAGTGFVSADPDADGVVRRTPLLLRHGNALYASFPLEIARAYLLQPQIRVHTASGGGMRFVTGVQVTDAVIRTDARGQVVVPYRGPRRTFPYIPATDILNGTADRELLFNSIALVGTSAIGLFDLRATPLDKNFPGVEVHASILDGILNGGFPFRPEWQQGANLAVMAALALLCALLFPLLGPAWLTLLGSGLVVALWLLNFHLWRAQGLDLPLAGVSLVVVLIMVTNLVIGFLKETSQRRKIKGMFDQYVPPAHIETMLAAGRGEALEGENREMTVLFADVRGFTSISEKLSAAEIKAFLNTYLTPVTEAIFEHNGTIDKYVGDMVMAFWGAPLSNPDHGTDAVRASLRLLQLTREMEVVMRERGFPPVAVGIGLNSGFMNVGDMGSRYRRAYTVIGDAVNLAARLEGMTRVYEIDLIAGDGTRDAAPGFEWRLLDRIRVKGKEQATRIWQPVAEKGQISDAKAKALLGYRLALDAYFGCRWEEARRRFRRLLENAPDRDESALAQVFLERIGTLERVGVEPGWDGSYRFTQK